MPKQDLVFSTPILNSAGSLGFAPDPHAPVDWSSLGAFFTNPISMRARAAVQDALILEYPGGILIHSSLPNPGLSRVLDTFGRAWGKSALPIVVHLIADRPDETRAMVRTLESVEGVLAVELGFAPLLSDDLIQLAMETSVGELPIIVSLPREQLLRLGPKLVEKGAAALSLAPPRGAVALGNMTVRGRLMGAALLPESQGLLLDARLLGLPIIAHGGARSAGDVQALLRSGAIAVQMDLSFWLPPGEAKSPVS